MGVEVVERSVDRTELLVADEAFFGGTGMQMTAITRVDHRPVGSGQMGPVTRELREFRGEQDTDPTARARPF